MRGADFVYEKYEYQARVRNDGHDLALAAKWYRKRLGVKMCAEDESKPQFRHRKRYSGTARQTEFIAHRGKFAFEKALWQSWLPGNDRSLPLVNQNLVVNPFGEASWKNIAGNGGVTPPLLLLPVHAF